MEALYAEKESKAAEAAQKQEETEAAQKAAEAEEQQTAADDSDWDDSGLSEDWGSRRKQYESLLLSVVRRRTALRCDDRSHLLPILRKSISDSGTVHRYLEARLCASF